MDQKTIDKVLRCRAIIDRHRDWLRDKFDKLQADMVAEIPDHDRFVSVTRMLAELKAEGFGDVGDYANWDNQQCLAAYIEYAPIDGKCDHCEGWKGMPPCQAKWGEKACAVTLAYPTLEWVKRYAFYSTFRAPDRATRDALSASTLAREAVTLCPPGHGFHAVADRKTNDADLFPFDLRWEALR